jgi:hypothetical protein
MMLNTSFPGEDEIDDGALKRLLALQLPLGRPLRFSRSARDLIQAHLPRAKNSLELQILFHQHNRRELARLQTTCRNSVESFLLLPYRCLTTIDKDGNNVVPLMTYVLSVLDLEKEENQGLGTFVAMALTHTGLSTAADRQLLTEANSLLDRMVKDVETIVRNDSFFMGLVLGVLGPGSFADAFPAP